MPAHPALTRRSLLLSAAAAGSLISPLTLSACNPAATGGDSAAASLSFTWWGNDVRDEMTNSALDLFSSSKDGLTITREVSDFSGYWDKLATQTAAKDMRDVMQFGDGYLAEYASRGALLDLEPYVDLPGFSADVLDSGRVDGTLVGINGGINVPAVFCNTRVLADAGIAVPDDSTWTWDGFRELSAAITQATADGVVGSDNIFAEGTFRAFIRQHDEELFTQDGQLGVTEDTLRAFFDLQVSYLESGAIPAADVITENLSKTIEQSTVATGTSAFALFWSNQNEAVSAATEDEIVLLRMPTVSGTPEGLNAWYHPSQLWTAAATTSQPELAGELISWWVGSAECAEICRDERGLPASTDMVAAIADQLTPAGTATAKFIADLEPYLGDPQPIPPAGASAVLGDLLTRTISDLLFASTDPAAAATSFLSEAQSALS